MNRVKVNPAGRRVLLFYASWINDLHWPLLPCATPNSHIPGAAPLRPVYAGPTNDDGDQHLGNMLTTLVSVVFNFVGKKWAPIAQVAMQVPDEMSILNSL